MAKHVSLAQAHVSWETWNSLDRSQRLIFNQSHSLILKRPLINTKMHNSSLPQSLRKLGWSPTGKADTLPTPPTRPLGGAALPEGQHELSRRPLLDFPGLGFLHAKDTGQACRHLSHGQNKARPPRPPTCHSTVSSQAGSHMRDSPHTGKPRRPHSHPAPFPRMPTLPF